MILCETKSAILSFDPSIPCLELIIKPGIRKSKEFRTVHKITLEKFIEFKMQYPDLGLFIDARDLDAIKPREMDWLAKKIFPQLEEAGLTKKAFLFLDNQTGKIILEMYKDKLSGSKIVINEFKSFKDARVWLKDTNCSSFN
ncbi:MAG: hypothetical protein COZ80_08825 [Ignavibacteria bacterium CG_4_8_14_3_um_filter_37_9]|nr:hypothetical protein [Ignavibacteria bacterium]PIP76267.1 MAG: hypothetical protein COW85_15190 [Ignavibacteria bacterium CG22_combo_CG10-13_8_21_14_all_37_15]PIS44309.1 MAG: hypothetical protein COT22_11255 [Ignavibacteria bacterium CG08_land_8_20_14_0_20_37_9]PIW98774.1 MAG: hypothetical protein COZ80_08825 [Ignavibacteria bacterium CG_4_8_14_3_um_filter_37_9]PJC59611.1 MAG: hypothetical protein CO025_05675 [Ignavibacteria bacterium CG_4_9_14_0_2_um_filter_37_13]